METRKGHLVSHLTSRRCSYLYYLYYPAKPSLDSWGVRHNYAGVLSSLNQVEFRMSIRAVTREYTPGSFCNSRNPIRHPPRWELRPESPALGAEQFHVHNQTRKEPQCAWWNTRESPRPLSQDEKNTVFNSGMQNTLVYPRSTRDEAHFPFIGSITIPCSTSCRSSGLNSFRKLQRLPDTQVSSVYEY